MIVNFIVFVNKIKQIKTNGFSGSWDENLKKILFWKNYIDKDLERNVWVYN